MSLISKEAKRMSRDPRSCGFPLLKKKYLTFHMLLCNLFVWADRIAHILEAHFCSYILEAYM